jgi:hypothetical protein
MPLYDLLDMFPSELIRLVLDYEVDLFLFNVQLRHRTPIVPQDKKDRTRVVDEKANEVLMGFPPEYTCHDNNGAILAWDHGDQSPYMPLHTSIESTRVRLVPDAPPRLFPVRRQIEHGPRFVLLR